ncbi:TMEM165/GDT1 family protein [Halarsenatibacter silvermanii]|uniref:GDT1 family protein n=1 Tax=Halarsenatibacter silvermanii TaxID=321763 RepID=A0A1G9H402_9FIRM|nr:TMEM165/GDT1 family protein [Halarsenatibacter silvermanii]SDL07708.1 Putative Ca2+/H+ antiporter, TMEM165/GDT1 family [Halarsenatibacter silvermanii]
MELIVAVFMAVFFAEMGDKTQLTTLIMSGCPFPRQVFLGAISALFLVTAMAVGAGRVVFELVPENIIVLTGGIFFLAVGIVAFFSRGSAEEDQRAIDCEKKAFTLTFSLVFLAEMGDKTQLTVMSFAAVSGRPLAVLAAAMAAQSINHGLAAFMGSKLLSRIPHRTVKTLSALIFLGLGILIIAFSWL